MVEKDSFAVEEIGGKLTVPSWVPRIHTPHEALSEQKARELDYASWEMSQNKGEDSNA